MAKTMAGQLLGVLLAVLWAGTLTALVSAANPHISRAENGSLLIGSGAEGEAVFVDGVDVVAETAAAKMETARALEMLDRMEQRVHTLEDHNHNLTARMLLLESSLALLATIQPTTSSPDSYSGPVIGGGRRWYNAVGSGCDGWGSLAEFRAWVGCACSSGTPVGTQRNYGSNSGSGFSNEYWEYFLCTTPIIP